MTALLTQQAWKSCAPHSSKSTQFITLKKISHWHSTMTALSFPPKFFFFFLLLKVTLLASQPCQEIFVAEKTLHEWISQSSHSLPLKRRRLVPVFRALITFQTLAHWKNFTHCLHRGRGKILLCAISQWTALFCFCQETSSSIEFALAHNGPGWG